MKNENGNNKKIENIITKMVNRFYFFYFYIYFYE